ncbi:hypothetical protein CAPTEDRAFT_131028 [Capitella teleta]|uniref:3-phosphoinositide-dependent protein kinase 1 n=1 Tax=Capitella teleta TaxID=283909 RepID=R7TCL7_CAPTE|nr:hypothetical protein CAPTEDRAFT_131028 [Capitella teleta]|eukprot:ELT91464.1 hypothetical protein CAPTEDRAFT_131028 [Capitella teleta]
MPSNHASSRSSLPIKKKPSDFIFGKVIGEGSYSTVILAKEVSSKKEYAIKVLEKKHILQEKKKKYVMREKEVFSRINHPFFVRLYFTFQDENRLYFGLGYCKRGELLDYLNKLGSLDCAATQFYTAEIVLALEHLHNLGIIHRDLKPENILLDENMHIQITDFGSAKILGEEDNGLRRNSFVGTAQYVSPEVLNSKESFLSSDLWALGCIVFQFCAGKVPFWGGHEYQIFQKIIKLEYEFPHGFDSTTQNLVEQLLNLDPRKRLGCKEMGGYAKLKAHPFFEGVDWDNLPEGKPPELQPYLPACGEDSENLWGQYKPGLDDQHLSQLQLISVDGKLGSPSEQTPSTSNVTGARASWANEDDRSRKLDKQSRENDYHRFVEGHLILKQGLLDKRVGLFARRRMMLLTEGPHLYYVDPQHMVLKGEIPWSEELKPEAKNFKIFFVHTPNRTYYLEDPSGNALKWCDKITEVWRHYYDDKKKDAPLS